MRVFTSQNLTVFTDFQPGDKFVGCNFSQEKPHTGIGAGVAGLRFEGCNLNNCDLPADAIVVDGVHAHFERPVPKPLTKEQQSALLEKQAAGLERDALSLRAQAAMLAKAEVIK